MTEICFGSSDWPRWSRLPAMAPTFPSSMSPAAPRRSQLDRLHIGVHVGAAACLDFAGGTSPRAARSGGGCQAGCNLQWRAVRDRPEGEFWVDLYDRDFFRSSGRFHSRPQLHAIRWDGHSRRSGLAFRSRLCLRQVGVAVGKFDYSATLPREHDLPRSLHDCRACCWASASSTR